MPTTFCLIMNLNDMYLASIKRQVVAERDARMRELASRNIPGSEMLGLHPDGTQEVDPEIIDLRVLEFKQAYYRWKSSERTPISAQ